MTDIQPSPRRLVTESMASKITGLSRSSLRRDREDGRCGGIPFRRLGNGPRGTIRYALEDLTRFLERPAVRADRDVASTLKRKSRQSPARPRRDP